MVLLSVRSVTRVGDEGRDARRGWGGRRVHGNAPPARLTATSAPRRTTPRRTPPAPATNSRASASRLRPLGRGGGRGRAGGRGRERPRGRRVHGQRVAQRGGELRDLRVAVVGVGLEGAQDHVVERRRDVGARGRRRRQARVGERGEAALAHRHPGEQLVGHGGQGVDVGPRVDAQAVGLLGRHVGGRADHLGEAARVQHRLGHPQVGHQQPVVVVAVAAQQQVGWLDVAVHDALPVQHPDALGGLADEVDDAGRIDGLGRCRRPGPGSPGRRRSSRSTACRRPRRCRRPARRGRCRRGAGSAPPRGSARGCRGAGPSSRRAP